MIRKFFIFIFLLNACLLSYSQSYNFKNYSVENGLPFIQIFSIHQDARGYLWTTGYGGLSRFDGKEFINYGPKNGLANHYATVVASCNKGNLWIGTKSGLNEFVAEKIFKTYTTKDGLPSSSILSLVCDWKNKMYIGTDSGLCFFETGKFTTFEQLKGYQINCLLYRDETGVIAGTDKGLFIINKGKVPEVNLLVPSTPINCLAYNTNSGLWAGTPDGLMHIDPQTGKTYVFGISNGLIDENITTLTCDYKNNVWVGTHSGLMRFNGKEFSYYKISSDINSNNILSSAIDYEENLWFGTHAGLFKYRDEGFVSYGPHDGLIGTMVFPIARDNKNILWIGTEQFGLFKYENNIFEQIKNYDHKLGDTIHCFKLSDSKMLIGHNAGITISENGKFTPLKGFPVTDAYTIFKDSRNTFWAGSAGAIYSFGINENNEVVQLDSFHLPVKTTDYQIWGIEEDNKGTIWLGAYLAGLFKLSDGKWKPMNKTLNIHTPDVFTLIKNKAGLIYAASLDGVYEINPETNTSFLFNEEKGLSSNLVYSILLTNNENILWAGTNQGANKINLSEYKRTGRVTISTYGKADGFKGVECNVGSWEDADGTVWFSTVNGLVKYNPSQLSQNTREAKLNFTGIKLFYNDTILSDSSSLPYDLNNISFHYTGICLSNPEKVRYIHKLEGFDRFWSPESKEDVTRYSNLPPGSYTFKVRCCNNEGIWNQPVSFSFTIRKPYYQEWWFLGALILLVVTSIILVFRIRLNQLKKEQRKEAEKQIEISKNQLKALRSQMNPHFMFNSLNSIQNYIVNNKDDSAILYLNKFAKLMRLILNNSEKSLVTLKEELDAMHLYIELEQMRFQNAFQYKIEVSEDIDQDFEQIPTMLIQPYVENAILHGLNPRKEPGGLLLLEIRLAAGVMVCSIIDNGIGRAKSTEIKRNSAKEHKSMGMDITKQRLQILNSINESNLSVRITDLKDEKGLPTGTKVDIFIPVT